MPGMFASWIHGNALVVEGDPLEYIATTEPTKIDYDDPLSSTHGPGDSHLFGETVANEVRPRVFINHLGWGTEVRMRPGTVQWFHIPLPTPVIHDDRRLYLDRFFLLWKLEGDATLEDVTLWDGMAKMAEFSGLAWTGDHTTIDTRSKIDLFNSVQCVWGFGISFAVVCKDWTVLGVVLMVLARGRRRGRRVAADRGSVSVGGDNLGNITNVNAGAAQSHGHGLTYLAIAVEVIGIGVTLWHAYHLAAK